MNTDTSMMTVGITSVAPDRLGTALLCEPFGLCPVVRDAVRQAGVGECDVPLSGITEPSMTVLLKPNWVLDRNEGGHGMECLVTQPGFVRAALTEVVAVRTKETLYEALGETEDQVAGTYSAGSTTVECSQPMCKPG